MFPAATCEMCGMVGVRDAFYSKTKRFCSVSCSRTYSSNSKKASILARLQVTAPSPRQEKSPGYSTGPEWVQGEMKVTSNNSASHELSQRPSRHNIQNSNQFRTFFRVTGGDMCRFVLFCLFVFRGNRPQKRPRCSRNSLSWLN